MKLKLSLLHIFLGCAFGITWMNAAISVDRMFSDGMVLQRGQSVPVWGTADAGESVTVSFRDQSKKATAGKDGKWLVKLDALKVGPAGKLTVLGKTNKVEFKDVLVGEVWIGSGPVSSRIGNAAAFSSVAPMLLAMPMVTAPASRAAAQAASA